MLSVEFSVEQMLTEGPQLADQSGTTELDFRPLRRRMRVFRDLLQTQGLS